MINPTCCPECGGMAGYEDKGYKPCGIHYGWGGGEEVKTNESSTYTCRDCGEDVTASVTVKE